MISAHKPVPSIMRTEGSGTPVVDTEEVHVPGALLLNAPETGVVPWFSVRSPTKKLASVVSMTMQSKAGEPQAARVPVPIFQALIMPLELVPKSKNCKALVLLTV